MLQLIVEPSSSIVRKGDNFSVEVHITNRNPQEIEIKRVTLSAPIGFIHLKEGSGIKGFIESFTEGIRGVKIGSKGFELIFELGEKKETNSSKQSPFIAKLQSGDTFTGHFHMGAGSVLGLQPRPDTYSVVAQVEYIEVTPEAPDGTTHNESAEMKLNLFPSHAGMLGGAGFGSILGTIIRVGPLTKSSWIPSRILWTTSL